MIKTKWILTIIVCLMLIQTAYTLTASAAGTGDWTTFHHDLSHSGSAASSNFANSAKPLWNYSTGAPVVSSPSVVGGYVVVGSKDGRIYCLKASDGQLVWNFTTCGEVDASPAITGGCALVGSNDGWLYRMNMTTGLPVWISFVGGEVLSSPAVVDGFVYVGSGKHDVLCFNASSGVLVWTFATVYRVDSAPAISKGSVYVATDDFCVYALNASTGHELWSHHTGSVISSPCVYDGCIYVGSYDGYVCCLNATNGDEVWRYLTEDCVDSSPAAAYGCIYVGSEDNNLYCFNASSGAKIWQTPTGYWIRSSPAVSNGNVYVGSEDYSIYCFNASTGAKKWSYSTGNIVDSSPAIVNGTLYVGSSDCRIYALTLTDSAPENMPPQSSNSLALATIAFDFIAFALAAAIIFTLLRFGYTNKQAKKTAPTIADTNQKPSWFSAHTDALCILAILAFSIIFYVNLGSGTLWAADEQTYSQWAYHMVRSGDYVTPYAFGGLAVWIGKPPLFMWLVSLGYQALGVSNVVTRLWSPVFGSLTLVLVFFLGKKLYNSTVGLTSALVLGTFTTYYLFARHAMTDATFVFFIVASFYFFVLSEKTEKPSRYAVLSGLFFGLALLTKQVEALLIPLIVFSYLLVTRRSVRFVFSRRFTVFWGVGLLILVPWLVYMFLSFGSNFWLWFVVYCGFTRTISPIEGHSGNLLFYFNYLANNERLWSILLPFAAGLCVFNVAVKRLKADTLILSWTLIVLLVFTFAQTKLPWYILPAFPAFAIAISSMLYQAANKIRNYQTKEKLKS
jgi:outer membrane protein assembly factor BamB